MNDNNNLRKKPPTPSGQPEPFQPKVLLIWLGFIALLVVLWTVTYTQPSGVTEQLTIQAMLQKVKNGDIVNMTIKGDPTSGGGGDLSGGTVYGRVGRIAAAHHGRAGAERAQHPAPTQKSWPLGVPLRGPRFPPQRLRAIRLRSLVTHCQRSPLRDAPSARDRI